VVPKEKSQVTGATKVTALIASAKVKAIASSSWCTSGSCCLNDNDSYAARSQRSELQLADP
jgi:hypothetical protein